MVNIEEFYKEVAYSCWLSKFYVGECYEGMRTDFDKLWEDRKTVMKEQYVDIVKNL